ncbi:MAG TPA: TRAP transporter small permease subunit [Candidatus Tectomicrobia bacterium]|nr:TRAP transporter small permease subunit [Candidatus Tectomicrobia bacterium]
MTTPVRAPEAVDAPPAALVRIVRIIDAFSEWTGRLFAWMIIPLMCGTTYEVVARYLFNAPTIWAYDMSYMLYGSHFMLGAGYTLLKGGHIRTDIFYQNWSPRRQGAVDALLYLLFFFPGMIFFFWSGGQEALHSWQMGERSDASPWRPIVWPLKMVLPVTALLILIQGVSEFIKSSYLALRGRAL